ncbi:MAG: hypothetical protein HY862_20715 [Chloroflexi bacterium]|nr:hypothetical protein [Chloroflexota bacterium]
MLQDNKNQRSDEIRRGQGFISDVHKKMSRVAQEFAAGELNRTQFLHIYDRYQRQILLIAQLIAESDPTGWREAITDGEDTVEIRRRYESMPIGLSVYSNRSGMPIETVGDFQVEPELVTPMFDAYASATAEIFQAAVRNIELENGGWLCFVRGHHTSLLALFSFEPASFQVSLIEKLHADFEVANVKHLAEGETDPAQLAHSFYSLVEQTQFGVVPPRQY